MSKIKSQNLIKEREKYFKNIYKKIISLKSEKEAAGFLDALLTKSEKDKIARRLAIAKRMVGGESYTTITTDLGVGDDTVARVRKWIDKGFYAAHRKDRKIKFYDTHDDSAVAFSLKWVRKRYPWHSILLELFKN